MSLLISTVAIGSRNRLAPLAEAPWTMPGIAALCSARTISTKRPWRLVTTWSCRYFAVSRPRANCSSVVRSLARWRRSRSRIDARAGLASSTTSPLTSMARAHRRDLVDERGEAADQALQDREAARRPVDRRPAPRRSRRRSRRGCAAAAPRAAGPRPPGRRAPPRARRRRAAGRRRAARRSGPSRWWPPAPAPPRRGRSAAPRPASAPCPPASARSWRALRRCGRIRGTKGS